ncbi:MAG: beta strand repeat-containing protein, partial [Ferruginibacter sp.]
MLVFIGFHSVKSTAQTTVFSDDFSTVQSATYTTSGAISTSGWTVLRSGADYGARRNTSPAQLELTNDASGTANANGWILASTAASSFSSPYNTTLDNNTGIVTWTFNMRQIRTDPSGFASGSYAVAFVLAGQSTTTATAGNGYAVVLGQTGGTDAIRLVRYATGLQGTQTDLITSNTSGLTDFGTQYLSLKVTFNPLNDQWELFLRNDGASAFVDPLSGSLVSQGTVVNTTYTSTALTLMGGYWQGANGGNQPAFFDNVDVTVATTPFLNVSSTSLAFGNQANNTNSASNSFNLFGANLTGAPGNITVTAPTHFQVSNDNSTWGSSTTIAYTSATLVATPVYVRFSPTSTGAKTGNITFSGGGVSSFPSVALTGTSVTAKVWDGSSSNDWNTNANWTPSGVPTASDAVVIDLAVAITVSANAVASSLTISNSRTVSLTSSGGGRTLTLSNVGTALNIQSGSSLTLQGSTGSGTRSMDMLFTGTGNFAQISGALTVTNVGEGTSYNATNSTTTVSGSLTNSGASTGTTGTITSTASNLIFADGGTYVHFLNGGIIPLATWDANSNFNVTGWTTDVLAPTNITQAYGNINWNSPSQSDELSFAGTLNTVNGNFNVISTGTGSIAVGGTGVGNLTIAGNYVQSGGTFIGSLTAARTITVNGNFNVSGGTFDLSSSTTAGNAVLVNIVGDFSHTAGTITESGSTTGSALVFTKTGSQTFTSGGTVSNIVNYTINSGSILEPVASSTLAVNASAILTVNGILNPNATALINATAAGTLTGTGVVKVTRIAATADFNTQYKMSTYTLTSLEVEYAGLGNQTINTRTYSRLTSGGTGDKTLAANTSMTGALKVYAGSTLALSTFTLSTPTSVTMDGGASAASAITGSGLLTLGGTVTVSNVVSGTGNNGASIGCPVALGANRIFSVADDGTAATDLSVNGIISGVFTLTKNGLGTMVVSGANSYTGATTVSVGKLNVQNATGLGTVAGGVVVSTGAALELQGGISIGAEALDLSGEGISAGGALINLSGNNTWGGAIALSADTRILSAADALTLSNTVDLKSRALTIQGPSTSNNLISGIISSSTGGGSIQKVGDGTWTLSGANTFAGGVILNRGTLNMNNAQALGTIAGTFSIGGAGNAVTFDNTSGAAITTLNYPMAWNNDFTFTGTNTINFGSGAVTLGGDITATIPNTLSVGGNISGATYNFSKLGSAAL